ncbi:MAG: acyl-ACP--UDP-N-acetylglucosamine O-acyltransferase [Fimbriimonadaceae bacterium]|nr:acyl-ACP--UDP-N-acetylglucosamine O-acyltransferase [Fimbriimonadaceae bacterium]
MSSIHPTAIVDPGAQLGLDVTIGAFSIIEPGAVIGDRCSVGAHAVICSRTTLGADCVVHHGAILGGPAQDLKCDSVDTRLEIGERNTFREYVTVHRSNHEGGVTVIGCDNYLMAQSHVGHDAIVGNHIQMANQVALGGHSVVDDRAVLGGLVGVHQRVRVGTMAMVGGMSGLVTDLPPYCVAQGMPAKIHGLNVIGLRRNSVGPEARRALQTAVRELFLAQRHRGRVLEELLTSLPDLPEVRTLLTFVQAIQAGRNGRQLER